MLVTPKESIKNYQLSTKQKNDVLESMIQLIQKEREIILQANANDVEAYLGGDQAMYDRLIINDKKIEGMIESVRQVKAKSDPVGKPGYQFQHPNGMIIKNISSPFGCILIIYESRPDVTIEAAVIAFKAGNRIQLKGGKEAIQSNRALVNLWHKALELNGLDTGWIQYLDFSREQTQNYLKSEDLAADLIIPRGGEKLIQFVKENTSVPVLVSGRGNNFIFIHQDVDWSLVKPIIINAKTQKISACNALDKILVDKNLANLSSSLTEMIDWLLESQVEVWVSNEVDDLLPQDYAMKIVDTEETWKEEFLSMKIVVGLSDNVDDAIEFINKHSGGHSVSILSENENLAEHFMSSIDAAAVYHNASTRFTDGGQFGLGAEMAISTDKLHHRGPLGLEQLVSNKWFVYGKGHIRK